MQGELQETAPPTRHSATQLLDVAFTVSLIPFFVGAGRPLAMVAEDRWPEDDEGKAQSDADE